MLQAKLSRTILAVLSSAILFSPFGISQTPQPQASTASSVNSDMLTGNFLQRLAAAYLNDWKGASASSPAPARRIPDAPLDAPPFPSADWNYGGSPIIGTPDGNTYPLMTAINGATSRTKIYGWFNGGFDVSTSNKTKFANSPAAYYVTPNTVIPDQQVLYIERLPDTVQTQHIDWGFRIAQLYGQDYRYTTGKGYLSQQLLQKNNTYGYDAVMVYADIYFPKVADGMNVRIGRYISLPDIEAQLAPNNYTYGHSILYTIDPYTQTGIVATIKLNNRWLVQAGLSGGNDVALWTPDATPTLTACVSYTWNSGKDNMYPCINSLNGGKYAYDNTQSFYNTWYHKFNSTWHMDTEAWYMYERDVPNIAGNVANPVPTETGANGAFCSAGEQRCFAPEWAALNYVEHEFSKRSYLSIRNEIVNDMKGQRTGYKTKYSEHMVGWGYWVGSTVAFRPEIRYEHSYDLPAYDNGTKKNQLIVAGDVTYHF
jgi:hypothetical protein